MAKALCDTLPGSSNLDIVQTILRHLYVYSAPLCEALRCTQQASLAHECKDFQHVCCKVVIATDKADLFCPDTPNQTENSKQPVQDNSLRAKSFKSNKAISMIQDSVFFGDKNTLQTVLDILARRIGSEALYSYCSLYVILHNGCLLQINGPPVYNKMTSNMIPIKSTETNHSGTQSRPKRKKSTSNVPANKSKAETITLEPTKPRSAGVSANPTVVVSELKPCTPVGVSINEDIALSSNTEQSVILITSSPEEEVAKQQTSLLSETSAPCSSEELFSSATTNDSVIFVRSEPPTVVIEKNDSYTSLCLSGQPSSNKQSSKPPLSDDSPILCDYEDMEWTSTNKKHSIPNSSNSNSSSSDPSSSSGSSDELSGDSSDECVDFLSNRAYRSRKRKHPSKLNRDDSKPLKKVAKRDQETSILIPELKKNKARPRGFSKEKKRCRKASKRKRKCKQPKKKSHSDNQPAKLTRTRMFFATNLREVFSERYVLNVAMDTRQVTELMTTIFSPDAFIKHVYEPQRVRIPRRKKTSVRSRRFLPLLTQLLKNHRHNVRYHYLLQHYCPIPEGLLSPDRVQRSSPPPDDPTPSVVDNPEQSVNDDNDALIRLVNAQVHHDQVYSFLCSVFGHLIPLAVWGSKFNKKVFFRLLRKFVDLRRWETMTVRQMCERFKLSHCKWLQLPPSKHRGRPHPPLPHLFEKFIYWLFEEVVIQTVKTFFYVTEKSENQNHVYYYRKKVWSRVQTLGVQKTTMPFEPVPKDDLQSLFHFGRTLGISKLRFLPKANGIRPIINFGSMVDLPYAIQGRRQQVDSVNKQLQDAFHVLNFEKTARPHIIGSMCFGHNDIHRKLKEFTKEQKQVNSDTEGPFLLARVDISSCYDSMLPDKMFEIVTQKVLSKRNYMIRRYATVFISQNKIRRMFIRVATHKDSCEPFFKFALNASKTSHNCIYTDQVKYSEITRTRITDLLKKHLYGNLVKLGQQHYRQIRGIAHGSKVSSMLCGFYYADMEKTMLPKIDRQKGLLMRFVDDFLLITREPAVAKEFLVTMQNGIPEYNCTVNAAKTVTNFRVNDAGQVEYQHDVEWVEWCGLLLNTKSLDIRVDYSRYSMKHIRDNVTIHLHKKHYSYFVNFVKRAVRLRCLSLLVDSQMLTEKSLVINLYQGFLIAGVKYLALVKSMPGWRTTPHPYGRGFSRKDYLFFFRAAVHMFVYFWRLARSKCMKSGETKFTLSKSLCVWLGCHSLKTVLFHHEPRKLFFLTHLLSCKVDSLSNQLPSRLLKRCFSATKRFVSNGIFTVRC